jgi:hypothetical protein
MSKVTRREMAKPVPLSVSQRQAARLLGIRSEAVRRLIAAGLLDVVGRGTPRVMTGVASTRWNRPNPSKLQITLASVEARRGPITPLDLLRAVAPDMAAHFHTAPDTDNGYPW